MGNGRKLSPAYLIFFTRTTCSASACGERFYHIWRKFRLNANIIYFSRKIVSFGENGTLWKYCTFCVEKKLANIFCVQKNDNIMYGLRLTLI